ncbi:hypothetical protein [Methylobacterium nigriterrae]|uniref:hypothetical protein n=1 Tax=Methylobacterium nigriterrae TaxID=3127512 RepID=UPI003014092D
MAFPLYVTDPEGWLTYYNDAAVELWGRRPEIGKDRWCGSWRIYKPDGTPVPHDQCGMAVSLREGRALQGVRGLLERPDGTMVQVVAYPFPLRDPTGAVIGGSNVIVSVGSSPDPGLDAQTGPEDQH